MPFKPLKWNFMELYAKTSNLEPAVAIFQWGKMSLSQIIDLKFHMIYVFEEDQNEAPCQKSSIYQVPQGSSPKPNKTPVIIRKQPSRGVLRKTCSKNMEQIYRRTPMLKCDINIGAKHLYWNRTSTWLFSSKFAEYFWNNFS